MVRFKIYFLGGLGFDSNIYLIDDERIALIDAGTGRSFEEIKEEIEALGVSPRDIEILINTHSHFDHAGGDRDFFEACDCQIMIHKAERRVLEEGDAKISCAEMFGEKLRPVKVARGLKEGDIIGLGTLSLRVIHTPGHTAGSICLYDPNERILFSGDTVFSYGFGRTDMPTGDEKALIRSLKRLRDLEVEKLYPGHGPPTERDGKRPILNALSLFT